jgi:hypothetical protein
MMVPSHAGVTQIKQFADDALRDLWDTFTHNRLLFPDDAKLFHQTTLTELTQETSALLPWISDKDGKIKTQRPGTAIPQFCLLISSELFDEAIQSHDHGVCHLFILSLYGHSL